MYKNYRRKLVMLFFTGAMDRFLSIVKYKCNIFNHWNPKYTEVITKDARLKIRLVSGAFIIYLIICYSSLTKDMINGSTIRAITALKNKQTNKQTNKQKNKYMQGQGQKPI